MNDFPQKKQAILVIQLRQLGDILLTTPCLKAIKEHLPESELFFLSHKMGYLIAKNHPYIDHHLVYDEKMTLKEHLALIKTLRSREFDLVFDFMNNPRSAFFCFFTKSKKKLSFHSSRNVFYHEALKKPEKPIYIVKEKALLLNEVGIPCLDFQPILPISISDKKLADNFFESFSSQKKRIFISPTHRRPLRKWPAAFYSQLADWLWNEWKVDIFWGFGPGEKNDVLAIQKMCKAPSFLIPDSSFREMSYFIQKCDFFIGNSNGPSHIAVAVGTPSLQLHGHTFPDAWCPNTDAHQSLQSDDLSQLSVLEVCQKLSLMKPLIFS